MKKVVIVSGTRPEVIKLAPIYKTLKSNNFSVKWISTGQHKEMLEQAHKVFGINPDYELNLMKPNQTPLEVVGECSSRLQKIFTEDKPDMVIVQGDTASTLGGALAAFYCKIPVAHIEAGLRSFNLSEPFPEEGHRKMVSAITSIHFAPTKMSAQNLYNEGIDRNAVRIVGNTVVDALLSINEDKDYKPANGIKAGNRWILVTAHRRENHGERLQQICQSLLEIRDKVEDAEIFFPVHLNPNVQKTAREILENQERIHLLPPLDYFEFVQLMRKCKLVLTDSGGVQEEAPSFNIPVLVLREQTERPEAVEAGMAKLVGSDKQAIVSNAVSLLTDARLYSGMAEGASPFGDGRASGLIADNISVFLENN